MILDYQDEASLLQQTSVAPYTGVTVWTRQGDLSVPDEMAVAAIQMQTFVQDQDKLLTALQDADDSTGLGSAVTSVQASITVMSASPSVAPTLSPSSPYLTLPSESMIPTLYESPPNAPPTDTPLGVTSGEVSLSAAGVILVTVLSSLSLLF